MRATDVWRELCRSHHFRVGRVPEDDGREQGVHACRDRRGGQAWEASGVGTAWKLWGQEGFTTGGLTGNRGPTPGIEIIVLRSLVKDLVRQSQNVVYLSLVRTSDAVRFEQSSILTLPPPELPPCLSSPPLTVPQVMLYDFQTGPLTRHFMNMYQAEGLFEVRTCGPSLNSRLRL